MEYRDNYTNGYKSGYSSADDPDRKDYSPYGVERAQRSAMAASEARDAQEESRLASEKYWENVRQKQEENRAKYWQEVDERKKSNERRDRERVAAQIIVSEERETYFKQSRFKRAIAKFKGKDYYSMQGKIFNQAMEQVSAMSDRELTEFIETHENGRIR